MKKRIFGLVFIFVLLFFVGCSADTPDPTDPSNVKDDGKITLTYVSDSVVEKTEEYSNTTEEYIPVKEGFDFVCWTIDGEEIEWKSFEKTLSIFYQKSLSTEITLSAKWKRHEYKVTLDVNGGEELEPLLIEYKKSIETLPTPVKADFTFLGWYTDKDLTTSFDLTTSIEADFTLYAKWIKSQFTLTFNSNGGNDIEAKTVNYNESVAELPDATKLGHIFKGWFTDSELTKEFDKNMKFNEDVTIYAKWEIIKLTVKFLQSDLADITVDYGSPISNLPVLTKDDHEFKGWYYDQALENKYVEGTPVTENISLYPRFSKLTFLVRFETNGGAPLEDMEIIRDTKLGNVTTTRLGYRFKGWYSDSNLSVPFGFNDIVSSNMVLYAGWEALEYEVTLNYCAPTYVDENGELKPFDIVNEENTKTVAYGSKLVIKTPSIKGYKFDGWYTSSTYKTPWNMDDPVTKSMTLYAKWSIVTCTIEFETFVGTAVKDIVVNLGEKATRPANPTRTGYTFRGWFTDRNCTDGNQWDWNTPVTKDMTLYAKWQENIG